MTNQHSRHNGTVLPDGGKETVMVAGCDLGKATAKFVLLKVGHNGSMTVEDSLCIVHNGRPLDAFRKWYHEKNIASCVALAATGGAQAPPTAER